MTFSYPCGLPTTYLGQNMEDLGLDRERGFYNKITGKKLSGLAQVCLVPPGNLFLPCLGLSMDGKFKFPLCQKCAKEERAGLCEHEEEERALTGTWTTEEIVYAVFECNYTLKHTYEAFLYSEEKKLFHSFYSKLATMKLESEGFPKEVVTEAEKEAYCRELNERMPGLALDPKRVQKNMARRNFSKLVSNATLGEGCGQVATVFLINSVFSPFPCRQAEPERRQSPGGLLPLRRRHRGPQVQQRQEDHQHLPD